MATRYIHRGAALPPIVAGLPNANSIRVDSDTDLLTFGTGSSGTTEKIAVDETSTQTLSNKTITGTGALTSSSPSAGIGYATGAGGAVTQITSRATGVTVNAVTGAITTINTSLAAEASAVFTVTNSSVAVGDVVAVAIRSGMVALNTRATVTAVAAGSFDITIVNGNVAAGTAETGAIIINFAVIKGVSA